MQLEPLTFTLPPNTILEQIKITTIDSNITIIPIISQPLNPGDIITFPMGQIGVFKEFVQENSILLFCHVTPAGNFKTSTKLPSFEVRKSTQKEIDFFKDILYQYGYSFNFETLELEQYRFKPKFGDTYYSIEVTDILNPVELIWEDSTADMTLFKKNLVFPNLLSVTNFIDKCMSTK